MKWVDRFNKLGSTLTLDVDLVLFGQLARFTITVHNLAGYLANTWFLSVPRLGIDKALLQAKTLEAAKAEGMLIVRQTVNSLSAALDKETP